MQAARLVECHEELAQLHTALDRCRSGTGQVVVLTGPVATGKTELLLSVSEALDDFSSTLTTARATERNTPLAVVQQLIRNSPYTGEERQEAALLLDEAGRFGQTRADPGQPVAVPSNFLQGLSELWAKVATRRPLFIGVDDIHHSDAASLECLLHVVRQLRSSPIAVVLTESEQEQQSHPLFHTELLRDPSRPLHLRSGTLSESGTREMLSEHLDMTSVSRLAPGVHAISGGNPLLIRALIAEHTAAVRSAPAQQPDGPVVGRAFGQAVLTCVHRSGELPLRIARALAMLGGPAPPQLLDRVFALKAGTAVDVVAVMERSGLLRDGWFRHDEAKAAMLADPTFTDQRDLHYHIAKAMQDEGTDLMVLAEQLIASGRTDDVSFLPVLRETAEHAIREERVELAIACLELVCRAETDPARRAESLTALAQVEWQVKPTAALRRLPTLLDYHYAGALHTRDSLKLIKLLLWYGQMDEAAQALKSLDRSAAAFDLDVAAELPLVLDRLRSSYPSLLPYVPNAAPDPDEPGVSAAHVGTQAAAVVSSVLTKGSTEETTWQAEQVLSSLHTDRESLEAASAALFALMVSDRLALASSWCLTLQRDHTIRDMPNWLAMLSGAEAEIALRNGDLRLAREKGIAALDFISPRSWGIALGYQLGNLVRANTEIGDYAAAARYLSQPLPQGTFQARFGVHYLYARGRYNLATGRLQSALADFVACGDAMRRWEIDLPTLIPWRSGAAMVHLRTRAVDQAEQLLREQMKLHGGDRPRVRGASLRLLAATVEPHEGVHMLKEATRLLQECGDRLELAHAVSDLSQAYQAMGETRKARVMARRAAQLARLCHAKFPLTGPGSPPYGNGGDGPDSRADAERLSGAEQRVADLAAHGHTNREIAKALFITVSTVEQHLTQIYRKLNVNRNDLVRTWGGTA